MLSIIAAKTDNNVIGKDNMLPWLLADDLKRFQDLTRGHTVIMGRKTYESIGRPLPNRENVVLSRSKVAIPGVAIIHDIAEIGDYDSDVFIIGGSAVYEQTMDMVDRLYITEVHTQLEGDAFFPAIDPAVWHEVSRKKHYADIKNQYDVDYVTYERR